MKPTIRLPLATEGLNPYLEALAGQGYWEGVETSAAILDIEHGWEDLLDAYELPLLSIHSLLPTSVSRYLAEAGEVARHALISYIRVLLEKTAAAGIEYASIDLGANRDSEREAELVATRATMLRSLMPMAEALEISVCLPRRLPSHQPHKGPDSTLRLVNDVSHRCCRVALNIYPDELPTGFDIRAFLRSMHLHIGLIRWYYEPHLGIRLTEEFCGEWFEALRWLGYRGPLVICPQHLDADAFRTESARVAKLLGSL